MRLDPYLVAQNCEVPKNTKVLTHKGPCCRDKYSHGGISHPCKSLAPLIRPMHALHATGLKIRATQTKKVSSHTTGICPWGMSPEAFLVCVHVVILLLLCVPATCPHYMSPCVNSTLFCRCKMLLRHVPTTWPLVCTETP